MLYPTQILEQLDQNTGVVSIQTLLEQGLSYHFIKKNVVQGRLLKLKQGVYKWANEETNELVEVAFMVPKGVFCLQTACFYYGLTTNVASEYHIAIPDMRRVTIPNYPPVKIYYWNNISYNLGISTVALDNQAIKIYDLEKTVCDTLRYRQKIGFDIVKEVLKNYLKHPDRNLSRLNNYARQLNIQNKVDEFIKILL